MPKRRPPPRPAPSPAGAPRDRGQPQAGPGRLFLLAVPGLAGLLTAELAALPGVRVHDSGFDGRSDVVLITAEPAAVDRLLAARLAEDLFVEVGRTLRAEGDRAPWIAGRLWRSARAERALAARARLVRPLRARASFRVVVRVRQERSFLRTDLRRHLTDVVARQQPQWRLADPADLEIWVTEYQPGQIVAGLRASGAAMRQHEGRTVERSGALRPTVAAAMVRLAGAPAGVGAPGNAGVLLDPCCGSGTILAEAAAAGWRAAGLDIDRDAVRAARRNAPAAPVGRADARRLPVPDRAVGACVANLPFGRQYELSGDPAGWLGTVLTELARVTRPGGRVVLLAPSIPRPAVPAELRLDRRVPIRLLGTRTVIWAYHRR